MKMEREKLVCSHCGNGWQDRIKVYSELMYSDGEDEPNTTNHLVSVKHIECMVCGEVDLEWPNDSVDAEISQPVDHTRAVAVAFADWYCNGVSNRDRKLPNEMYDDFTQNVFTTHP